MCITTRRIVGLRAARWATCLLTQRGFFRLSLNRQIVGVSIDCQAAVHLLHNLVIPHHRYAETAPAFTTILFDELVLKIIGYRQVSDATLLHLARVGGLKLVTFDRPVAAVCPWPQHLAARQLELEFRQASAVGRADVCPRNIPVDSVCFR
jgi:predicted nucleic acid-binding protein